MRTELNALESPISECKQNLRNSSTPSGGPLDQPVVPKIANPRNHQGAGLGAGLVKGWSRGPPEGREEFLKFCLHSDMGPSRALSSVLILIWGFLGL